jgi:hypothetical protein
VLPPGTATRSTISVREVPRSTSLLTAFRLCATSCSARPDDSGAPRSRCTSPMDRATTGRRVIARGIERVQVRAPVQVAPTHIGHVGQQSGDLVGLVTTRGSAWSTLGTLRLTLVRGLSGNGQQLVEEEMTIKAGRPRSAAADRTGHTTLRGSRGAGRADRARRGGVLSGIAALTTYCSCLRAPLVSTRNILTLRPHSGYKQNNGACAEKDVAGNGERPRGSEIATVLKTNPHVGEERAAS